MAGFTSEALEKKLSDLNNSQQSIQTLSLWLIHHRKHHAAIIQTWSKELRKARQSKKLTFMYLANDVIQNSRKKGPEFTKEFATVLKAAFENVAKEADDKTWVGLDRILSVWQERNIYDAGQVKEFRKAIGQRKGVKEQQNNSGSSKDHKGKSESEKSKNEVKSKREKDKSKSRSSPEVKRRKVNPPPVTSNNNHSNTYSLSHNSSTNSSNNKNGSSVNANNKSATLDTQPKSNVLLNGDVIDPDSLLKSLQLLENSASSDAAVREKIASLPPEVSDASVIDNITDKGVAEKLCQQVDEACSLLLDYNNRLSQELEDRKQISNLLASYIKNQKDMLAVAEQNLAEYKEKLRKVTHVRNELKSHLQNLPDLSLLPSVTGGLAPLPSAGDLFNIAAARAAANQRGLGSTSSASPNTASPADYETVSTGTPNSGNEDSTQRS